MIPLQYYQYCDYEKLFCFIEAQDFIRLDNEINDLKKHIDIF